ncbi:hypothetical protein MMC30_004324 [Trapelia coarctata]|nr:hypothetical protein [Trapelia coarctata]
MSFVNLGGYQVASDSRALTVNTIPTTNDGELLVIFEESGGSVRVLHGTKTPPNTDLIDSLPWTWKDITTSLRSAWYPSDLHAPFSCSPGPNANNTPEGLGLQVVLYDATLQKDPVYAFYNGSFIYAPTYNIPNLTFSKPTDVVQPFTYAAGTTLMVFPYGFWVNGTHPSWLWAKYSDEPRETPLPTSPFPFMRLATTTPVGSAAFYLYHQIDATTFAQDVFDNQSQRWWSFNISIETS